MFTEDEWKIVIARFQAMPKNFKVIVGGKALSKDQILKHLKKRDEIGKVLVRGQINFLRSFKGFKRDVEKNEK